MYYTVGHRDRLVIITEDEKREKFIELHSGPLGGHNGITLTLGKISNRYFWPGMVAEITDMVSLSNSSNHELYYYSKFII